MSPSLLWTCLVLAAVTPPAGWREVLRSGTLEQQARTCQRLGEAGTDEAVPALAALLADPVLNTYARQALERIGGPATRAVLRDQLGRLRGPARLGVIESLGTLREAAAVPALIELSTGPAAAPAAAALRNLGRIATEPALARLLQALSGGDAERRAAAAGGLLLAAESLTERPGAARRLYDAVLDARVPLAFRAGAVRGALVTRRGAARAAFLREPLRAGEPALRQAALLAARAVPGAPVAGVLTEELRRVAGPERVTLIRALGDCHDQRTPGVLLASSRDADPAVRLAALTVLARIDGPNQVPRFLEVLRTADTAAESTLAADLLAGVSGVEVEDRLLAALAESPPDARCVPLIEVLARRGVRRAVPRLLPLAVTGPAVVRVAVCEALASLADTGALVVLRGAVRKAPNADVRRAAQHAILAVCQDSPTRARDAARLLQAWRTTEDPTIRRVWAEVLASLGDARALDPLSAALRDTKPEAVREAIGVLGRWPGPAPVEPLLSLAESDTSVALRRRALTTALQLAVRAADTGQADPERLLAWFERAATVAGTAAEKRLLISGLGRVPDLRALRRLVGYAADPTLRSEALHAVAQAAAPLVRGPQRKALAALLAGLPRAEDAALRKRLAELRRAAQ